MFKSRIMASAVTFAVLFLTTGCVVIKEYTPPAKAVKANPAEYELSRKLLQAFIKNDAKGFVALLPEETQSKFTVKSFASTRKSVVDSVGEPVAFSYVTTLKLETLHPQIWKVTFRRKNVNNTKEYTSEVLFKVVTGMTDAKTPVITGFHFL